MGLLESISEPADLRLLDRAELDDLAAEIRAFLVGSVSRTGGHLGPNLGVVELTMAVHRVFDSPRDTVLFDTGHQSYVHKILTGRREGFATLRQADGLSGYPCRAESEHDVIENSHASTALSYADGLAKAYALRGETDRSVVVVVGDGALTGGMTWEALNNIAARSDPVVIVVNDNERSYAPTIGGLARKLATLRTTPMYERALTLSREMINRTPVVGPAVYDALHGMKRGIKDVLAPQGLFEDLGLKYVGPVDGHNLEAMEHALRRARAYGGPVIVHALTRKGNGYAPAETDDADRLHAVGVIDPETGHPVAASGSSTWTSVFSEEMLTIGAQRPDVVAITAAMCIPVGLDSFSRAYPDRCFDVGIAEQHAVTSAAGLAAGGMHPVVALYATFLNRAFDQVLLDAALHRAGITFVLDRAGVTGDDGASHNGLWDLAILQVVPGLRIAAPRDAATLRAELREALAVADAPTVVRFPKGPISAALPALGREGGVDVLRRSPSGDDVLLVAVGAMVPLGLDVADRLAAQGIGATVVDPRWVKPLDEALVPMARRHRLVVSIEDGIRAGGVGWALAAQLRDADVTTPVRDYGIREGFPAHARRDRVLAEAGITPQDISREVVEQVARLGRFGVDLRSPGEAEVREAG